MATIKIVKLDDLSIASSYEADAPNQAAYGGPWGRADETIHLAVPEGVDADCAKAVLVPAEGVEGEEGYVAEHIAIQEDAVKKAAKDLEAPKLAAKAAVSAAIRFGNQMVEDFAVENVLLGITQDGMTGAVLDKMAGVMEALRSGSLYEAIARIKAIPLEDKDAKYITDERLLEACNKCETFLGIALSETL